MSAFNETLKQHWRDVISLVLGLWLIISPWALGYLTDAPAAWNAYIVGIIVVVAAAATLVAFHRWEEWINVALGAWLIVSPFLMGQEAHANVMWNQIITGVLIGGMALWAAFTQPGGRVTA